MPALATAVEAARIPLAGLSDLVNFLPLVVILLANLAVMGRGPRQRPGWYWIVLAILGVALAVVGAGSIPQSLGYGLGYVAGGVATFGLAFAPVRRGVARILPTDPESPLDATAVGLTVLIACSQAGVQLSSNVLSQVAAGAAETPVDQVLTELPFLLAALLGVGFVLRRSFGATLTRLGITAPRWWHLVLALVCAGAFYAFGLGAEALQHWLTPGTASQVGSATRALYRGIDTPVGVVTIALVPAICEETLFRGALQPRLGLWWTAIVFALLHSQYGLSIDELAVVILAVGLGLLRRFTNTTTSMLCHAVYNTLTAVQAALFLAWPGVAVEGVLIVVLVVAAVAGQVAHRRSAS